VYLALANIQSDHDVWLFESGASFYMTPHREYWFYEYERYEGGDVFLGDNSTTKIVRQGRFQLIMQYGRCSVLPGVLHISDLARNLISISKMSNESMHTLFHKDAWKMVKGAMVLMKGVQIGTLYKFLRNLDSTRCNYIVVPEFDSTQVRLSQYKLTRLIFIKLT
jgi:hypothetical protein